MTIRVCPGIWIGGLALALVLGCCFPLGAYEKGVQVQILLKSRTDSIGRPHQYLRTDRPEVIAALVDIAPGAQTGWHLHWFPVYAYVLSGTLQVELEDGRTNVFKQGQVIVEVQKLSHNGRNIGPDPVRLIVFYTGEAGQTPSVTTPRADQDRGQSPPGTGD